MQPTRVRFGRAAGEYELRITVCPRLDCECKEAVVRLTACRAAEEGKHVQLHARVDLANWREVDPPQRPPLSRQVMAELLRDYPETERARLRRTIDAKKVAFERLATCILPPGEWANGKLMSFADVVDPDALLEEQTESFLSWRFGWMDRDYMVLDHYCMRPACACREVHLTVLDETALAFGKKRDQRKPVRARVGLDDGQITIGDRGDESQGRVLLMAWQERFPGAIDDLTWRYDRMKEVARRSIAQAKTTQMPSPGMVLPSGGAAMTPSRNEPCPCGSGRKYKNCCGR